MTLRFQHRDGTVDRVDGAAIKFHFAELAALRTGQLERKVGRGFPHHPLLNAAAQRTSDGVGGSLDLAEVNRPSRPPFGGMKVGRRLRGFTH